jgi:hypothetical protein
VIGFSALQRPTLLRSRSGVSYIAGGWSFLIAIARRLF